MTTTDPYERDEQRSEMASWRRETCADCGSSDAKCRTAPVRGAVKCCPDDPAEIRRVLAVDP